MGLQPGLILSYLPVVNCTPFPSNAWALPQENYSNEHLPGAARWTGMEAVIGLMAASLLGQTVSLGVCLVFVGTGAVRKGCSLPPFPNNLNTSPSSICVATSTPIFSGIKSGVTGLAKNSSVWHSVSTSRMRSAISSRYNSGGKKDTIRTAFRELRYALFIQLLISYLFHLYFMVHKVVYTVELYSVVILWSNHITMNSR